MKNILVVDDSALMRKVLCDIINSDERFHVQDWATNGLEALDLLSRKTYDAVLLDVNMPQMDGLQLLKELHKFKISARVMMVSTTTGEGTKTTLEALELGAMDFIRKPENMAECRGGEFKDKLLHMLEVVANSEFQGFGRLSAREHTGNSGKQDEPVIRGVSALPGNRIVAIASSTGGPKALQSVIPKLPENLNAPVVLVQHMPVGFTNSLAERLDSLSHMHVKEAAEGDVLQNGTVYVAKGGKHLNVVMTAGKACIHYSDEPNREGVKPCANYMYESLANSRYDQITCVVMTGMGADGTKGIVNLKEKKKLHVIAQEESTCAVYGMPKSIVNAGLANKIVPLEQIAQEIIMNVGVK